MALTLYLAMTAAEMQNCTQLPEHAAWMACHFSPYSNGISNIPQHLPAGSMLILNDRIPPQGHDPKTVATQLAQAAEDQKVSRVLLDLQRPGHSETKDIVKAIMDTLPCPTAVTPEYAHIPDLPVFLTPQLRKPLQEQLMQWKGREIWLEAMPDCQDITVTEKGSHIVCGHIPDVTQAAHTDEQLHCQYSLTAEKACARFTVWRNTEQLQALLKEAEALGIECAVGLYQQLRENAVED